MSYKEKPQLKLYSYSNNEFVLQAIIDDYAEVSFEHNLYSAGVFTISINYNIPNSQLFQRGLFIQFGNNPYDFGEIYSIQDSIGEDGKGSQIRTITGYDARYILKRRVIKNMNSNGLWVMTAKGELCLRNLIKDQCGSGAEAKRQLPINNVIPASADAIGKEYSVSENFSNLYEVCKTIATQSEIGWRIAFENGALNLEVYAGSDLSQTVRFDTNYESLANGEFSDSSESFSNAIYIGGKGQNDNRDIYEGEDGTPSGFDRFESWDNQSQMTTESEYEAEALSMLSQYGQTLTMQGNGLAKCPYIFREQYDIGDIITVAFSGKSAVAQILSVTEHWAWGSYDIQFSFGKPQNNLAEQLQLMLRQIQKASEKASSTDSVRWYTIPTDSAMPKADVTYNTIGFIGTVGTNATFTLYLDNEKTGAKTYHVWFKQLGGTGKLTLTTGKAGAVNLTMEVGTYVAIISVDEAGNIIDVASTPINAIQSGNMNPVTSNAVYDNSFKMLLSENNDPDNYPTDAVRIYKVRNYSTLSWLGDDGFIITIPWNNNYIFQIAVDDQSNFCAVRSKSQTWNSWQKIIKSSDVVDTITSDNPEPVSSSAVYDTLINGGVWSSIKSDMSTSFMYKKIGNFVSLHINTTNNALKFTASATNMQYSDNTDVVLPNAIRPQRDTNIILIDNTHDSMFHARIFNTGVIRAWKNSDYEPQNVASWNADIIYRID